jgi:uncharacterized damage-inducible protein DinB
MSQKQALIAELKMEAANTRKILERVPVDKNDWKPHHKSMSLGRLATHVAEIPGWVNTTLNADELDFATTPYEARVAASNEELLNILDKNVADAVTTLENVRDEEFDRMWTMRNGEQVYFTLPKKVVLRTFAFSHNFHHRGQLGVYLRLLDVPVPGMYGPTADEMN